MKTTRTIRIPLLIRETVIGMLMDEGEQHEQQELCDLSTKLERELGNTASTASVELSYAECIIIDNEVFRGVDGGAYDPPDDWEVEEQRAIGMLDPDRNTHAKKRSLLALADRARGAWSSLEKQEAPCPRP